MFVKFDFNSLCKKVLEQQLDSLDLKYKTVSFGEVEFLERITPEKLQSLSEKFDEYGIEIIENQKTALVQKIKDAITEMVFSVKMLT